MSREDELDEGDEEDEEDQGEDEDDDEDEEDDAEDMLQALQQLLDMGFPEARAKKALTITHGHAQMAMDWLLEHEGDPDIDEPLTDDQLQHIEQDRQHHDGPADQEAVQRLIEMGFSEDDILNALETCGNNFESATAWLLGDREAGGMDDDPGYEESEGRTMLQSLMAEPHLQQALANPRVVAALQHIIEHPETAAEYLDDPEIGRVLQALGMSGAVGQHGSRDPGIDDDVLPE